MTLPCIVCGSALESAVNEAMNQPAEGLAFQSSGHYGSVAFDPMDGTYLEINVCDKCLESARDNGYVLHGRPAKSIVMSTGAWEKR